jgi:hypothetical protein
VRVKNWVKTVPTLVVIGTVLFLVLNTKLAGQVQTLFRGETLRGLLLYAWGWSAAAAVLLAPIAGFLAHERAIKHAATTGPTSPRVREPIAVG